ncbi:MAG: hypothetical protein J2P15_15645 [Micromonosporaceae bacterium]|nr:hypothetical protein [Micromonosporaceae bacterium]
MLDTDAVLAYAFGSFSVGRRISEAADATDFVIVPALCLAEAYRRADSDAWHYLDVLSNLDATMVTRVEPDDPPSLGGYARTLGSKHLAHAVIEAAAHPITPIMTSQRERVSEILGKGWPIVDVT